MLGLACCWGLQFVRLRSRYEMIDERHQARLNNNAVRYVILREECLSLNAPSLRLHLMPQLPAGGHEHLGASHDRAIAHRHFSRQYSVYVRQIVLRCDRKALLLPHSRTIDKEVAGRIREPSPDTRCSCRHFILSTSRRARTCVSTYSTCTVRSFHVKMTHTRYMTRSRRIAR